MIPANLSLSFAPTTILAELRFAILFEPAHDHNLSSFDLSIHLFSKLPPSHSEFNEQQTSMIRERQSALRASREGYYCLS